MKETDSARYFRFLKRLAVFLVPAGAIAFTLNAVWEGGPDIYRLLRMAALTACVFASLTTHRREKTKE